MTSKEAHALVQKEVRRRVRQGKRGKWGAENARILKSDRLALQYLKEHPKLFYVTMQNALHGMRHRGDGCYVRGRGMSLSHLEE